MIHSTVTHTHHPSFTYTLKSAHAYIKHIFPKRDHPKSHPVTWSSFMTGIFGMMHSPLFQISYAPGFLVLPSHIYYELSEKDFLFLGFLSFRIYFLITVWVWRTVPGSPYFCLEALCPQCLLRSCLFNTPGQFRIPGSAGEPSTSKYQAVCLLVWVLGH